MTDFKAKAEYKLNDKIVTAKEFDSFKSTLKELTETWFCAETITGGITGYDAVNKRGVVYEFRSEYDDGFSKISLRKKDVLDKFK